VALLVVIAAVAGLALGGRALWHSFQSAVRSDGCDFGSYNLDLDQAQIASTVVGVVLTRRLPERAAVLTLAAAIQESKLRNIPAGEGDRDSVGILQQRPSQGWGSAAQIADVRYATGKFLDAVVKVPNWQEDSLATVVQSVQFSADGSAYSRHEQQAQQIADALVGVAPAGVNCRFDKPSQVATGAAVAASLATNLPVATPSAVGRTINVPGAGWATSAWLVCNANRLGIDSVAYSGKRWTPKHGWTDYSAARADAVTAVLAR
jgi:hypothetical protein